MAARVTLHVGAMKSGTSYLQALLFAQVERLALQDVLVPGRAWSDQARAVRQALGRTSGERRPRWQRLLDEVHEAPGHAVISMEYLGPSNAEVAARVVTEVGGHVDVVITARDLNRTLVSMWQETVQNGRSWSWATYLAEVAAAAPGTGPGEQDRVSAGGTFWRQQHLVRLARTWSSVVGPEQVSIVTVPPPGADRTLLGRRFAESTGLDLDLDLDVATSNESLGLASILVLRRLNELLDAEGLTFPAGSAVRKRLLAKELLAARRGSEPALGLPVQEWVRDQTAATVAALGELGDLGVRLVGSWSDLDPVEVPGVGPEDVAPELVAEPAVAGLAGLVVNRARAGA